MQGTRVTIGTPSKRPSIFSFAYWFPSYSSSNRSVVATQEHAITRAAPSSSKGLRSWSNWTLPSFAFMRKTPSEKEMLEKTTDYCVNNRLDLSMLQRDPTKELVSYQIAGEDLKRGEVRYLLRSIFQTIKAERPERLGFVLQNLYTHCNARNVQEREVHAGEALTSLRDLKTLPIEKATGAEELITPKQFEAVIRKLHAYASFPKGSSPEKAQKETEKAIQKKLTDLKEPSPVDSIPFTNDF